MNFNIKSISKKLYGIWSKFLDLFGDVKIFKYPMWIVLDPSQYDMVGEKIAKAIEILQPGDIVLRGYDCYLDSHFIDGQYSHGAIAVSKDQIVHSIAPAVESIHPISFMMCDRIAIVRPKNQELVGEAVKIAKEMLECGVKYDFDFNTEDDSEVYCFELAAKCYPSVEFKIHEMSYLGGFLTKNVFLGSSFLENENFEVVFEYNPRKSIDFPTVTCNDK